jgi:hypothetical protein
MAELFFNRLPSRIDPSLAMERSAPVLWKETKLLYRNLRNPLLHGKDVATADPESLLRVLVHYGRLFTWVHRTFPAVTRLPWIGPAAAAFATEFPVSSSTS